VILYFGQFYENIRSSPSFWAACWHGQGYALILTNMYWATFWAIFSQTHLVTLLYLVSNDSFFEMDLTCVAEKKRQSYVHLSI
jgi:hypothetical protein